MDIRELGDQLAQYSYIKMYSNLPKQYIYILYMLSLIQQMVYWAPLGK